MLSSTTPNQFSIRYQFKQQQQRILLNYIMMQKKTGIRLRHLNQQPANKQIKAADDSGTPQIYVPPERQRSSSPLGRRKIFSKNSFSPLQKKEEERERDKCDSMKEKRFQFESQQLSPLKLDRFALKGDEEPIMVEGNETMSLLMSSHKKELERKDRMIEKLREEIQLLQQKNQEYKEEIKRLKEELGKNQFYMANNHHFSRDNREQYRPEIQKNIKILNHSAAGSYPEKEDRSYSHSNHSFYSNREVKRSVLKESIASKISFHQDSLISDVVSPLMILKNNQIEQNKDFRKKQSETKHEPPPFLYEYQEEEFIPTFKHESEISSPRSEWQAFQNSQSPFTLNYISKNNENNGKKQKMQLSKNNENNENKDRLIGKAELAIDDSKQFKFEDFNFSEISDENNQF